MTQLNNRLTLNVRPDYKRHPMKLTENLKFIRRVGYGTYGSVYEAASRSGKRYAVKKNLLEPSTDFSGSVKEMDLLIRLKGHPSIVSLEAVSFGSPFDHDPTPQEEGLKEDRLYFIFEYISSTLLNFTQDNYNVGDIKRYIAQILLGVEYMHSKKIIHRDIKPGNILWQPPVGRSPGNVKICDFGMSKDTTTQGDQTPRVVTCWYRAPEICVGETTYTEKSDMWSVGMVLFEMITRRPFLNGYDDVDDRILETLCSSFPNQHNPQILQRYGQPEQKRNNLQVPTPLCNDVVRILKIPSHYPICSSADYRYLLDLLTGLLRLDPDVRYSATQALDSPYFDDCRELIVNTRISHPPTTPQVPIVKICPGQQRDWGMAISFMLFNGHNDLPWYRNRVAFSAISMFDRYLVYLENVGQKLKQLDIELRFMVCLYVAIKYHLTMTSPPSFRTLVTQEFVHDGLLEIAEALEEELVDKVLGFNIHQETIYDVADSMGHKLDDRTVRDILVYYGGLPHQHRQPGVVYVANVKDLYTNFRQQRGEK